MKKLFFICICMSAFACAKAQGTLQFNQVLLLNTFTNSNISLGTVPAGKVWKVTGYGTEATGTSSCSFSLDGVRTAWYTGGVYNYGGGYSLMYDASDIWLPAGTTLTALGCPYYRWVSVIEFNIVP